MSLKQKTREEISSRSDVSKKVGNGFHESSKGGKIGCNLGSTNSIGIGVMSSKFFWSSRKSMQPLFHEFSRLL